MNNSLLRHSIVVSMLVAAPVVVADSKTLKIVEKITVSGLSSGAYMAAQFHVAFSEQVNGAALIAGGPLYCAQNNLGTALAHCMGKADAKPDLAAIDSYLDQLEQTGLLAQRSNLQDDKVWILHGSADTTVHPNVGKALVSQYQQWLTPANITVVNDKPFAHHFPTNVSGHSACNVSESPFIASCNYDAAGELLTHLLGPLSKPSTSMTGNLIELTQSQAGSHLAKTGFAYIPQSCAKGEPCQLHISFHGCKQHADAVGDVYLTQTGLNNYADTNNLVVLYPQVAASAFNPHGCWDWWGYSSEQYISNEGPQLQAVKLLAEQLYPQ